MGLCIVLYIVFFKFGIGLVYESFCSFKLNHPNKSYGDQMSKKEELLLIL